MQNDNQKNDDNLDQQKSPYTFISPEISVEQNDVNDESTVDSAPSFVGPTFNPKPTQQDTLEPQETDEIKVQVESTEEVSDFRPKNALSDLHSQIKSAQHINNSDKDYWDDFKKVETDITPSPEPKTSIQDIELNRIIPNPYQPRKIFNKEALQELADSIAEHGVIQPLVVTKTPTGFEIVVGERRFRASQLAGLKTIPAIVKQGMQDQTKLEVALIENIQRQELNPIEEAQAYDRLAKNFHLSHEDIAKKVGKSRPSVSNTMRLLNLPAEIQRGVIEGKISEGHARAILGLSDIDKQLFMYQLIQEQSLNVRQVESKVREITQPTPPETHEPDPKLMAIETKLRAKLGTQVKIMKQGRGGKITIDFFSDDELDELVNKMSEDEGSSENYFTV